MTSTDLHPTPADSAILSVEAQAWLAQLPAPVRLHGVAAHAPDLANRIAAGWDDAHGTEALLEGLLVESVGTKVAGLEGDLAKLVEARDGEAAGLRENIARLQGEIQREQATRTQLVETVDGDLCRKYEMIFSRRGGVAVVEVREGTCQGCRMREPRRSARAERRESVAPARFRRINATDRRAHGPRHTSHTCRSRSPEAPVRRNHAGPRQ